MAAVMKGTPACHTVSTMQVPAVLTVYAIYMRLVLLYTFVIYIYTHTHTHTRHLYTLMTDLQDMQFELFL